jgi:hypothetical protein
MASFNFDIVKGNSKWMCKQVHKDCFVSVHNRELKGIVHDEMDISTQNCNKFESNQDKIQAIQISQTSLYESGKVGNDEENRNDLVV